MRSVAQTGSYSYGWQVASEMSGETPMGTLFRGAFVLIDPVFPA